MTITHLAIAAEREGKQQPWTIPRLAATHDGSQQEACGVQLTTACPDMASSILAASAEAVGGVQVSEQKLPELQPAVIQEVTYDTQETNVLPPLNVNTHTNDGSCSSSHHNIVSVATTRQANKRGRHQGKRVAKKRSLTSSADKELAANAWSIQFSQVESVIAHGYSGYIFSYR
jgi:hypothetical protein